MTSLSSGRLCCLLGVAALILLARPVAADPLTSDELIIKLDGTVVEDFKLDESQEDGSLIFFPQFQANTVSSGGPTILYEPDGTTISDIIGIATDPNSGQPTFAFVSDSATESGVDPAQLGQFLNNQDPLTQIETAYQRTSPNTWLLSARCPIERLSPLTPTSRRQSQSKPSASRAWPECASSAGRAAVAARFGRVRPLDPRLECLAPLIPPRAARFAGRPLSLAAAGRGTGDPDCSGESQKSRHDRAAELSPEMLPRLIFQFDYLCR